MKRTSVLLSLALAGVMMVTAAPDADAKRLGSGKSVGMQRQAPANKPADTSPPPSQQAGQAPAGAPTQAAPMAGAAAPAAAAAATAGKRNWLGPVAGIAAGLGIAALFSHMGWGEGLANFMTMALLAIVAVVAIRFLMRRFAGGGARPALQPAGAGAPFGGSMPSRTEEPAMQRQALQPVPAAASTASAAPVSQAAAPVSVPGGMEAADFERVAKQLFIRLQAVNDAGAVDDLRKFTTPELFAALRLDVMERGNAAQQTDVVQLDARVIDAETSADRWTVSVRFTGLIREQADAGAEAFDETWHFVRPADGSAEWAIAGIQNNG